MPTQPTYPGVYIEEVPSGVRTITGVSTSITAFVGRTLKGPTERATRLTNFGAFEKQFGGLWRESTLSYAIRQFFQNGGTDAIIVRIVNAEGVASTVTLDNGTPNGVQLVEAEAGSNGHSLRVQVTDDGSRHIIVTEITRAAERSRGGCTDGRLRRRGCCGIGRSARGGRFFGADFGRHGRFRCLPVVAGPVDFPAGTGPAQTSRASAGDRWG